MVIDDFRTLHVNSSVIKYADNLTIMHFIRKPDDDKTQSEWDNVVSWSRRVGLPMNFSKCFEMQFVTKNDLTLWPIVSVDGNPMKSVSHARLLGVHFSCDMRWNVHVSKIVIQASQR